MTLRSGLRAVSLVGLVGVGACGSNSESIATTPTSPTQPSQSATDTTPLRAYAARRNVFVGSAIDRGFRYPGSDGVTFRSTMARQFNMLTAENDMKHDRIHPGRDTYRFDPADSLVTFAESNGMRVRGHTLVFHNQLAAWLTSGTWTKDEAKALLVDHITKVVAHYRGRVAEWDVVNEVLGDNGALRSGFWLDRIGPEYIELAFRTARAADPAAGLYYNDYNIEGINAKSDSAYAFVRDLLARGVPVTGVGFESHFQVGGVPSSIGANIARFAALGLKVHITELDIRLQLPSTSAQLATQAQNYKDVVDACVQNAACDTVVFWGFTDRESWIPSTFAGWGDALLLNASYGFKPAFTSVQSSLK